MMDIRKERATHAALPIGGIQWKAAVKGKLLDGFGADDIALHFGCHHGYVRAEIALLRDAGEFAQWWPK